MISIHVHLSKGICSFHPIYLVCHIVFVTMETLQHGRILREGVTFLQLLAVEWFVRPFLRLWVLRKNKYQRSRVQLFLKKILVQK